MHREENISWEAYQEMLDTVLDVLRDDIKSYLNRGEYQDVNKFLEVAVVPKTDHAILAEILKITQPYETLLSERKGFYDRVRSEVRQTRSEVDTNSLLQGL